MLIFFSESGADDNVDYTLLISILNYNAAKIFLEIFKINEIYFKLIFFITKNLLDFLFYRIFQLQIIINLLKILDLIKILENMY